MSIESVMPSNHLILCRPLLLPPSIFPSIRVFSNESALCIRWSKYWSFSFNISPSNEQPGLISFRMDRRSNYPLSTVCRLEYSRHTVACLESHSVATARAGVGGSFQTNGTGQTWTEHSLSALWFIPFLYQGWQEFVLGGTCKFVSGKSTAV